MTKLSELKLSKAVMQEFIWDVFGNPALLQLGLVDAEDSSDLDRQFLQLEEIWNEEKRHSHCRSRCSTPGSMPTLWKLFEMVC